MFCLLDLAFGLLAVVEELEFRDESSDGRINVVLVGIVGISGFSYADVPDDVLEFDALQDNESLFLVFLLGLFAFWIVHS
jgi:hypothetical protein